MHPVVLLHGFTGAPESFDEVVAAIQPVRCVVPALLGHGAEGFPAPESFEAEVDRLAAVVRPHGSGFHLAGYSLGGRLALGLLVRHPGLFRSATLIGAQPGLESQAERAERRQADTAWIRLLEERGVEAFVEAWEALPLFATQKNAPAAALAAQRRVRTGHTAADLARSLRVTGLGEMPSYWEALPRVGIPTTLMAGALDEKFVAIARAMAARMPHAEVRVVPGAGHNVLLEAGSAVIQAVRAAAESA